MESFSNAKVPLMVESHVCERLQVWVKPTDTVGYLRQQLQRLERNDQDCYLTLGVGGKPLNRDDLQLFHYNIHEGQTICMVPRLHGGTAIKLNTQQKRKTLTLTSDLHRDVSSALRQKEQIPLTDMNISVNQGIQIFIQVELKKLELMINPNATVAEIKRLIEEKAGVSVNQQILKFRDVLLENSKMLSSYVTRDYDVPIVLHLEKVLKMTLNMAPWGKKQMEVTSNDSITKIKQYVKRMTQVPVANLHLYHNGEEMADQGALTVYEQVEDCIEIDVCMSFVVELDRGQHGTLVYKDELVQTMKLEAGPMAAMSTRDLLQILSFRNIPFPVATHRLPILVQNKYTRETSLVQLSPSENVKRLKEIARGDIAMQEMSLFYKQKPLMERELSSCLPDTIDEPIRFQYKVRINVHCIYNGKTMPVVVEPSDNVSVIKAMVLKSEFNGNSGSGSRLLHGSKELREKQTVHELGLKHGNTVHMTEVCIGG